MLAASVKGSKNCSGKDKPLLLSRDSEASVHHWNKKNGITLTITLIIGILLVYAAHTAMPISAVGMASIWARTNKFQKWHYQHFSVHMLSQILVMVIWLINMVVIK